ncbi:UNVERIFIED_CONTAM: hypothetical protein FKN15_049182 [Acipenser sinensis]
MSGGDVVCSGWLRKSPPEKKLRRYASTTLLNILHFTPPIAKTTVTEINLSCFRSDSAIIFE